MVAVIGWCLQQKTACCWNKSQKKQAAVQWFHCRQDSFLGALRQPKSNRKRSCRRPQRRPSRFRCCEVLPDAGLPIPAEHGTTHPPGTEAVNAGSWCQMVPVTSTFHKFPCRYWCHWHFFKRFPGAKTVIPKSSFWLGLRQMDQF